MSKWTEFHIKCLTSTKFYWPQTFWNVFWEQDTVKNILQNYYFMNHPFIVVYLFSGLLSFSWDIYLVWERTAMSLTCTAKTLPLFGLQIFSGDSCWKKKLKIIIYVFIIFIINVKILHSPSNAAGLNRSSQHVSAVPLLSWKCAYSQWLWSSSLITLMFCSVPNSALWYATAQVRNEPLFSSYHNWFLDETLLMRILNELITLI